MRPPARRTRPRAAAALIAACALAAAAADAGESVVYYQVVYTNGKIRDLAQPPETDRGIRRVVRISRIDGPCPNLAVHSVDAWGIHYVATGRTVRKELRWDGKAWVPPAPPRPPRPRAPHAPADPTTRPAPDDETRRKAADKVAAALADERQKLKTAEKAVVRAAAALAEAKDTDEQAPAMLLLEKAQEARQQVLARIVRLEALLGALRGEPTLDESGTGGAVAPADDDDGEAPDEIVTRRKVLPHRLQVWRVKPARGRRTYHVRMAHAEAGRIGGFHYVAYADTDGDGRPDRLIARSPLAVADRPGGWTRWSFTTDARAVFVGNAWSHCDALQFHARRPGPPRDTGVADTEVFVSGCPWGVPAHRWTYPCLSNIHVRVGDQNPE